MCVTAMLSYTDFLTDLWFVTFQLTHKLIPVFACTQGEESTPGSLASTGHRMIMIFGVGCAMD